MAASTTHKPHWLVTCEHAGNRVPEEYAYLFTEFREVLNSHLGWDPGAAELANKIAEKLRAQAYHYPITRLLIEPNRSLQNPVLFSEVSRGLSFSEKQHLIRYYYEPYRQNLKQLIKNAAKKNILTIHLSIHTFTPIWKDVVRQVDIGILYDPQRVAEKEFCRKWHLNLLKLIPSFIIRRNQPYKGSADGIATSLRKYFEEKHYLGIELEVNQKFATGKREKWQQICGYIARSIHEIQ